MEPPTLWQKLNFDDIFNKPDNFERHEGRFSLKSNEGLEFIVHHAIMKYSCDIFKNWMPG